VPFVRSQGTSQTDEADDDQDDGVGVAEIEEAAAHLLEEKENTDGDHGAWAHQAADAAALATTMNAIAHFCTSPEGAS
jgi:hypothetical protein